MWEPRRLTTLLASMAWYWDSFTFFLLLNHTVFVMETQCFGGDGNQIFKYLVEVQT
jgi:hypothetical protein